MSDNFEGGSLDARWTFVDPVGDSTVSMTGTQIAISVPAGVSHDIWRNENFAPRIRQAANDTDFEIEVKFDSPLGAAYQVQGVMAEQDADNLVRFDFVHDGSVTKIYSASFANGQPTKRIRSTIIDGVPLYLRVTRQGDQWTESYSYDGVNWRVAGSYSYPMTVKSVAVYGGNAGSPAPAHTALVDYFIVDGLSPSDAGGDATSPALSDGTVNTDPTSGTTTSDGTSSFTGSQTEAGVAELSWVAPTTRTNGDPLPLAEIKGYVLLYGTEPGVYEQAIRINDAYTNSMTITDLPSDTYYFVVTTRDINGLESAYSEAAMRVVP